MASKKYQYSSNLAKGTGLINETLTLIEFYQIGESKQEFLKRCISQNILNKSTEHRTKDIINLVFFDRYWKTEETVIQFLKMMRENGLSLEALKTLFFIYTARANQVLYDFTLEIRSQGTSKKVSKEIAQSFLLRAISDGLAPKWSDSIITRVSSYLISCLKDFNIIERSGYIVNNWPDTKVFNYLIHELHFKGYSDEKIARDNLWELLGLDFHKLIQEIERISYKGTFIFQHSGEILRIGWNYKTMEEFIDNEFR